MHRPSDRSPQLEGEDEAQRKEPQPQAIYEGVVWHLRCPSPLAAPKQAGAMDYKLPGDEREHGYAQTAGDYVHYGLGSWG